MADESSDYESPGSDVFLDTFEQFASARELAQSDEQDSASLPSAGANRSSKQLSTSSIAFASELEKLGSDLPDALQDVGIWDRFVYLNAHLSDIFPDIRQQKIKDAMLAALDRHIPALVGIMENVDREEVLDLKILRRGRSAMEHYASSGRLREREIMKVLYTFPKDVLRALIRGDLQSLLSSNFVTELQHKVENVGVGQGTKQRPLPVRGFIYQHYHVDKKGDPPSAREYLVALRSLSKLYLPAIKYATGKQQGQYIDFPLNGTITPEMKKYWMTIDSYMRFQTRRIHIPQTQPATSSTGASDTEEHTEDEDDSVEGTDREDDDEQTGHEDNSGGEDNGDAMEVVEEEEDEEVAAAHRREERDEEFMLDTLGTVDEDESVQFTALSHSATRRRMQDLHNLGHRRYMPGSKEQYWSVKALIVTLTRIFEKMPQANATNVLTWAMSETGYAIKLRRRIEHEMHVGSNEVMNLIDIAMRVEHPKKGFHMKWLTVHRLLSAQSASPAEHCLSRLSSSYTSVGGLNRIFAGIKVDSAKWVMDGVYEQRRFNAAPDMIARMQADQQKIQQETLEWNQVRQFQTLMLSIERTRKEYKENRAKLADLNRQAKPLKQELIKRGTSIISRFENGVAALEEAQKVVQLQRALLRYHEASVKLTKLHEIRASRVRA